MQKEDIQAIQIDLYELQQMTLNNKNKNYTISTED
jgi:hypothetical protein